MTVKELQRLLKDKGFPPGPVDGVMGPMTRAAVRAFQKANGLEVDGIVGPITRAALRAGGAAGAGAGGAAHGGGAPQGVPLDMPWLIEAARHAGIREVAGPENNPTIMDWAKVLNIGYSSDEVPWCGLFVAHCTAFGLPNEAQPANPLGARQWLKFGRECVPQLGSTLVFWRGKKDGWKGHVGYYWAEDKTHFHVLGGNQSNQVNVKRLAKSRLLQARWPNGQPEQGIVRIGKADGSLVSTTEQ